MKIIEKIRYRLYVRRMKRHFWHLIELQIKHGINGNDAVYGACRALEEYTATFDSKSQSR